MKTILNSGDRDNKFGDTQTWFQFKLLDSSGVVDVIGKPMTVNIANISGYVMSVPVEADPTNTITIDFNSEELQKLTPDAYKLEVEVTMDDGDISKFPTKGGMPFFIEKNLKGTTGQLVPTVTFDEVLQAVDKKVDNYLATVVKGDKGDKGDTGTVDTSQSYTFVPEQTFNAPINGALKTRNATFNDFADVAKNMFQYAGNWFVNGAVISNKPNVGNYLVVIITPANFSGSGKIEVFEFTSGKHYEANVSGSALGNWKLSSDDSNVLHNTGNETAAGDKTFTGKTTFTQTIKANIDPQMASDKDLNNLTVSGIYKVDTSYSNGPTNMPNGAFIQVQNFDTNLYYQIMTTREIGNTLTKASIWIRMRISNAWGPWQTLSKDENVLHNTGDETADGKKTFLKPIIGPLNVRQIPNGTTTIKALIDNFISEVSNGVFANVSYMAYSNSFSDSPFGSPYLLIRLATRGARTYVEVFDENNNVAFTNYVSGALLTWKVYASDSTVIHTTGNETVAGDKSLTGLTSLNKVATTKLQDTTIAVSGINMRFIETSLGVNLLASGTYTGSADGSWKNIGTAPSNITLPQMSVVMNNVAAAGIGGVSLREGFTLFVRITETGSIDVRFTTLKSNVNTVYTASIVVDTSTNWIK